MLLLKDNKWLLPFFAGALACSIFGSFWSVLTIFALVGILAKFVKVFMNSKQDEGVCC